ncbi:MAG: glycosyltransferase family 25 protein [Gammaproteobacteria bacterium]|nr:MAG: glycosyltransferase family 25 protein [Gammaproteobacteria bacterium]
MQQLADGILVINLAERTDRWAYVQEELRPHVPEGSLLRIDAVKGTRIAGYGRPPLFRGRRRDTTWAGRAGCLLSHRKAIEHALEQDWKRVLILEDDVRIAADLPLVVPELARTLNRQHWGACYLGFTDPVGPYRHIASLHEGRDLYELFGCSTTHAYLLTRAACRILVHALPDEQEVWDWLTRHRAIDRWYARTLSRWFRVLAVSPSLINQRQGPSDITGRDQEEGHLTAVPAASSLLPYRLAMLQTSLRHGILNRYDALRGFIKRRRGF